MSEESKTFYSLGGVDMYVMINDEIVGEIQKIEFREDFHLFNPVVRGEIECISVDRNPIALSRGNNITIFYNNGEGGITIRMIEDADFHQRRESSDFDSLFIKQIYSFDAKRIRYIYRPTDFTWEEQEAFDKMRNSEEGINAFSRLGNLAIHWQQMMYRKANAAQINSTVEGLSGEQKED